MDIRRKTVSNVIAQKYWRASEEIGMSGEELLRAAGLTQEELLRENGRLEGHKHLRVVQMFSHLPAQSDFFQDGLDRLFRDFPVLAAVCANCPTQRNAIEAFIKFRGVVGDLDFLQFRECGELVYIEFVSESKLPAADKCALANFIVIAQIARHYRYGVRLPMRCSLVGPPPADAAMIESFIDGKVMYDQNSNSLEFSASTLDIPYIHFNAVLHKFCEQKLSDELTSIKSCDSFSFRVEQAIRGILISKNMHASGDVVLNCLCEQMNLTRWTLWRKLQMDGLTYTSVLLKVRTAVARDFLEKPAMSLSEISHLLGFSSQSSFSRFFKDQEGIAPTLYRHRVLGRQ